MAYAQLLQEIKYIDGGQGGKLRVVLVDREWRVQRSIPKNTFAGEGDYYFVTLLRPVTEANILYSCSLQLHGGGQFQSGLFLYFGRTYNTYILPRSFLCLKTGSMGGRTSRHRPEHLTNN